MEQIYEYTVVRATSHNYEYEKNFQATLDKFSKEGWMLKSTIYKPDHLSDTLFIFERYHPDYKAYNDEIVKYVTEAK